jgi:amino acid permease
MWQDNLFSNLLVVFILVSIFLIIYCRVTGKTITEILKEIWGIGNNE